MYQSRFALMKEIDSMRKLMIALATEKGYTSEETIRCSQNLDQLIYDYQRLCKERAIQKQKGKFLFRQMILLTTKQYMLAHA